MGGIAYRAWYTHVVQLIAVHGVIHPHILGFCRRHYLKSLELPASTSLVSDVATADSMAHCVPACHHLSKLSRAAACISTRMDRQLSGCGCRNRIVRSAVCACAGQHVVTWSSLLLASSDRCADGVLPALRAKRP